MTKPGRLALVVVAAARLRFGVVLAGDAAVA